MFFDGEPQVPFWVSRGGVTDLRDAAGGGVSPLLAARSTRLLEGATPAAIHIKVMVDMWRCKLG